MYGWSAQFSCPQHRMTLKSAGPRHYAELAKGIDGAVPLEVWRSLIYSMNIDPDALESKSMLQTLSERVFSEVYISDELEARPFQRSDFLREKLALQDLASKMVTDPHGVLPRFVELAMEMTGGTSAGLSILDRDTSVFRWIHLCGELSAFEGATTPRDYSPCGVTLDRRAPTLVRHPEWAYSWVAEARIALPEVLLVPHLISGEEPLGTLWIASPEERHFHDGHARVASELATLVGIALHFQRSEESLKLALEAQETLTREMNHRVKNVFALAEGMLRQSLRNSGSKEELAEALSGRLRALSSAHSLVMKDADARSDGLDLLQLANAITAPHLSVDGMCERIVFEGEPIFCTEKLGSSIALVLNELATNSAKYGALGSEAGSLHLRWSIQEKMFRLIWAETGGPAVTAPTTTGFGSRLVETTIVRQYHGAVDYRWYPEGLVVDIRLPASLFLDDDKAPPQT